MARVVRPGGLVLLTCDSGDLRRGAVLEARLAGKRRLARLRERIPVVSRVTDRLASGEWERGIEQLGLEAELRRVGLEVVASAHYSIAALKEGQRRAGWRSSASARQLWLALEEAFGPEREGFDPRMFANLYVHARRPA